MSTRLYPPHPITGVGALVVNGGRVLLVRRGKEPGRGMWSLPGGLPRSGERLLDAVVRELYEETGLRGRPLGVVWVDEVIIRDAAGVRYHYVLVDFLVDAHGEPRPGSDAVDARWFMLDAALSLRDLADSTRRLLRHVARFKNNIPLLVVPSTGT